MPRGTIDDAALETEIGQLPALSLLELRNRWKTLFGHSAPKSLRRNVLARAVAYQMQVEAYGGLSVATNAGSGKLSTPFEMVMRTPCLAAAALGPARR